MTSDRSAGLYARGGKYFVHPFSRTTAGVLLGDKPVIVLYDTVSAGELGNAVLESLKRYRINIPHPHPSEFGKLPQPILEAAGIKSWSTFSKGALACTIFSAPTELTITPSQREGFRGAYLDTPDLEISLAFPAMPEEVGLAVREALSRCK